MDDVTFENPMFDLVDYFYNEVSHTYGLRSEGRIAYSEFGIDPDGKTLSGHLKTRRSPLLRRGENSGFSV